MKISAELRDKIINLLQSGRTSSEIAEELHIGKMQVAGIKAHLNLKDKSFRFSSHRLSSESDAIPYLWSKTPPPADPGHDTDNEILIGKDLIFNKEVYWNYHPRTGSVNPHVLIVGETGFGKTYAAQCITAELYKKGLTTIIFDYGQGFGIEEASKDFIDLVQPSQIEASRNGVSINPLQIFTVDMMGPVNAAQRVGDTFARIYNNIGIQQKEVIIEAVETVFNASGIHANDKTTWKRPLPRFSDIHSSIRHIAESNDHPLKNPAKTVYSHISSFFRFNVIRDDGEKLTWERMVKDHGGVWIIQLRGLDHYVAMITTEMLLWNLVNYLQSRGPSSLELFVVLDEAHKLSFDAGTPVEWFLREGRKFGVGVILSSQQIEDYSKVALANTATKLVFQTHDTRGILSKFLARKCTNIDDHISLSKVISSLQKGTVFYLFKNIGRLVTIHPFGRR
jgi:DNA phosphorothioation-dependent restriction protein DptH